MWSILTIKIYLKLLHIIVCVIPPGTYFMCTYVHAVDACGHGLSSHTLYMYHKVRVDSLCDKNFGIFAFYLIS